MSVELCDMLSNGAEDLTNAMVDALDGPDAPHYEAIGPEIRRDRCGRLVGAFVASVRASPTSFVKYVLSLIHI